MIEKIHTGTVLWSRKNVCFFSEERLRQSNLKSSDHGVMMNIDTKIIKRTGSVHKNKEWTDIASDLIRRMSVAHNGTKTTCAGIDVRLSSPFVRQEVIGANVCLVAHDACPNFDVVGFAFVKKRTSQNAIYVTLMSSFKKGVGRAIVTYLVNTDFLAGRFLVVRSTDDALSFYLAMGFTLFDYLSLDSYVGDSDIKLTQKLQEAITASNVNALVKVRDTLITRNWIDSEFTEWPLLLRRNHDPNAFSSSRHSERLKERAQSQHLKSPKDRAS